VQTTAYRVSFLCAHYGVSRSGYYAWLERTESRRARANHELLPMIKAVHQRSHGTYGSPRITHALNQAGICCGENRVARLMRAHGIVGKMQHIYRRHQGTHRFFQRIRNLRLNHPEPTAPNRVWAGDVTYLKLHKRFYYLAVVLDVYSRKVIGWLIGPQRTVDLTLSLLARTIKQRQPAAGLIFHSDRGIEYASYRYEAMLKTYGIRPSMNRPGHCVDNAHVESFFHTIKGEWLKGNPYSTVTELKETIRYYIQQFYNPARLHSGIGYYSPDEYEKM